MNREPRIVIGELWLNIAAMYGKDITKQSLGLMLDAIADLDQNKVYESLKSWIKQPKNKSHPLPGDLIAIIQPEVGDETLALDAASRAIGAVAKFGWSQPTEAKAYIGDLGWRVVERYGGWIYICENLGTTLNVGIFQAQFRDIARSQVLLAKVGQLDLPPALPEAKNQVINLIGSTLKSLESKHKPSEKE